MALSGQMVIVQDALGTRCRSGTYGRRSWWWAMKWLGAERAPFGGARSSSPIPNQILW